MKATIIFLSFSIIVGCSTNNNYSIKGTVTGVDGAEWVYLQKLWSEELQLDSALIKGGRYSFSGAIEVPEIYAIFPQVSSSGCQPVCTFILEPAHLKIQLDSGTTFNNGTLVQGGAYNYEFNSVYMDQQEKFFRQIDSLTLSFDEANEDDRILIEQKIKELHFAENKYTVNYIESHPESPVSVYLLMWKFFNLPLDEFGHLLSVFSPEMKSTSVYKRMDATYQSQVQFKDKNLEQQP